MGSVENVITGNLPIWSSTIQSKSSAGRGTNSKRQLYGVKKLRDLILDLAVRGLLVPQDPTDEPASILIEKIAVEKEQLVTQGKIKKQKLLLPLGLEEMAFGLPVGWRWVRMQDIAIYIQRGKSPKYSDKGKVTVISQKCVQWSGFDLLPAKYINDDSLSLYKDERFLQSGDLIWNSTGTGTVGRIVAIPEVEKNSLVGDSHVTIIRAMMSNHDFIKSYLSCPLIQRRIDPAHENAIVSGSTKQVELNTSTVISIPIPLPPLAEQHRIVTKVGELMALCDTLERQQEDSIEAHETLVGVLLDALTSAVDADAFQVSWQRITAHFDVLFTTEHSIRKLKEAILQLAVMGKLVPQDPNDEPATVLLEKIAFEKEQLVKMGILKKTKPLASIIHEDRPFDLPMGWAWSRLPEIGELARGKSKHRPRNDPSLYSKGSIPFVQTGDVAKASKIITTYSTFYNQKGLSQSRLWPAGTMCITIAANIADTGILGFDSCFPDSVVGFIPLDKQVQVEYFEYFLRTAKRNLEKFAPSTAQKNINLEILGSLMVPLPPLFELNRIVSKIDELMALCDQLTKSLQQAQQTQIHLTDAVVENAV